MRNLISKKARAWAIILNGAFVRECASKVCLNYTRFLGYDKDENGKLMVVKSVAIIVRKIFELYLNGFDVRKIKKYLEENGIKAVTGKEVWNTSTIDRILSKLINSTLNFKQPR